MLKHSRQTSSSSPSFSLTNWEQTLRYNIYNLRWHSSHSPALLNYGNRKKNQDSAKKETLVSQPFLQTRARNYQKCFTSEGCFTSSPLHLLSTTWLQQIFSQQGQLRTACLKTKSLGLQRRCKKAKLLASLFWQSKAKNSDPSQNLTTALWKKYFHLLWFYMHEHTRTFHKNRLCILVFSSPLFFWTPHQLLNLVCGHLAKKVYTQTKH